MALDTCLRADGRPVVGIQDLGTVELTIEGDIEPIDRVELRGLGIFSRLADSVALALEQGPLDHDGPVLIRVNGQTILPEQVLNLTVDFSGRVPGTDQRLWGPRPLTRWEPVDRRQLVDVVPLEGEVECAHGGIRIDEGTDRNYNGTLDPDEIEQSEVICNGAPGETGSDGLDVLQTVEPAPADATCTEGGWRVSAGRDLNRDGLLQREEIESSATVCNGLRGTDGQDGPAGPVGREGPIGPPGPDGVRGPAGPDGERGPAGESGCATVPGDSSAGWWFLLLSLAALRRRSTSSPYGPRPQA
jgi:MYXO-CTERM domain-containing protein